MANKAAIERMLDEQLPAARARGRAVLKKGPRAVAVKFQGGKIVVLLDSGAEIRFPPAWAQGLRGASRAELSDVVIEARGLGLHWPSLDADLYVPALADNIFGTPAWMRAIGKVGGLARSAAKTKAARVNGAKGGRPRKVKRSDGARTTP